MFDLLLRLPSSALIANQVAGNEIRNVVAEWVIPGEIFHRDDVVYGRAHRVRPFEAQVNELVAFVADLVCT